MELSRFQLILATAYADSKAALNLVLGIIILNYKIIIILVSLVSKTKAKS